MCSENQIKGYLQVLKYFMRLYKAMFKKYAVVSNTKVQLKKFTFEGLQEQQNTMSLTEVYAFLNDFKLFGFKKLKRDHIQ